MTSADPDHGTIFISYRRDDTRQAARSLAEALTRAFGDGGVFRDIEDLELGVDFEEALMRALLNCKVMLVLIGPRWLSVANDKGEPRIFDPNDWVHQEIAMALKHGIKTILPVLIDGAKLPERGQLPEPLAF